MILGGGGYEASSTARTWAAATAAAAGAYVEERLFQAESNGDSGDGGSDNGSGDGDVEKRPRDVEIPGDARYFSRHGPDFTLHTRPSLSRPDKNSAAYLDKVRVHARRILGSLVRAAREKSAPQRALRGRGSGEGVVVKEEVAVEEQRVEEGQDTAMEEDDDEDKNEDEVNVVVVGCEGVGHPGTSSECGDEGMESREIDSGMVMAVEDEEVEEAEGGGGGSDGESKKDETMGR